MFIWSEHVDEVAEWFRRWTANPMGSARVGSNPILVDFLMNENSTSVGVGSHPTSDRNFHNLIGLVCF